jgi:transposase
VQVDEVQAGGELVRIVARTRAGVAVPCPGCGQVSDWEHSRYVRHVADEAVGGCGVVIDLSVRRLYCENPQCPKRTFVEQVGGLTVRYQRRTPALQRVLGAVAVVLAGKAGARLLSVLHQAVSWTTMLSCLMARPVPGTPTPQVVGIDDFSLRRGHTYGTIVIDMQTRRPVDVLPDREASTVAAWLAAHPGIEIICRDRGGAYAEGSRLGAPQAIQVADRYHLWANLGEAVDKTVWAHRGCVPEPAPASAPESELLDTPPPRPVSDEPPVDSGGALDVLGRPRRLVARTRERFAAVQELAQQGLSFAEIGRRLGLDWRTVRVFATSSLPELLAVMVKRASKLDPFKPYLNQRWNSGCTDGLVLLAEIRALGYQGGQATVHRYLHPFRATGTGHRRTRRATSGRPEPAPAPPTPHRVAGWIMTDPANLKPDHAVHLKQILVRCPHLDALAGHVAAFAKMMCTRRGDQLEQWMAAVAADDLSALHSMVNGIRRDLDAVTAGLTLPWNSGAVEGHVNRVKMLKRQMYGRAGFPLLRKRILLAN